MESFNITKANSCASELFNEFHSGHSKIDGIFVTRGCISNIQSELKKLRKRFQIESENDLLHCIKILVRLCLTQNTKICSGNAFSNNSESISTKSNLSCLNFMKNSINEKLDDQFIGEIKASEHQKKIELKEKITDKKKNISINEKKNMIENQKKLKILKNLESLQAKMKSMDLYLLNLASSTQNHYFITENELKKSFMSINQAHSEISEKNKQIEDKSKELLSIKDDLLEKSAKNSENLLNSLRNIELRREESNTQLKSLKKSIKNLENQTDSVQNSLASTLTQAKRMNSDSISSDLSNSESMSQSIPISRRKQDNKYFCSLKSMIANTKKQQNLNDLETKLKKQQEKQKNDSEILHSIYEELEKKRKFIESQKSEIIEAKRELNEIFKDWINDCKPGEIERFKKFGQSFAEKHFLHYKFKDFKITISDCQD